MAVIESGEELQEGSHSLADPGRVRPGGKLGDDAVGQESVAALLLGVFAYRIKKEYSSVLAPKTAVCPRDFSLFRSPNDRTYWLYVRECRFSRFYPYSGM
jgi:hypothetical protein